MLYLGTIPFHPSFTLWIQYQLPMLIISLQIGHLVAQSSIRNRIKDGHAMLGSSRSDMEQCSGMAIDLWLASRHHTHTYRGTLTITMASTVSSTPCVFVGSLSWNCRYPDRPLSLPECRLTSVSANSGTPYVLFSAKVMLKFSVNLCMTLLKIGHMGYLRLMHGPGYLST